MIVLYISNKYIRIHFFRAYLWRSVQVVKLTTNMRVRLGGDEADIQQRFSDMLYDVGEGRLARDSNNVITLPEGLGTHVSTLDHLISKVYDDADRMDDPLYIGQRTILCTTNVHVDSINDLMINRCRGISKTYLSLDTVHNSDYELTYSTEFLNSLNISGMPPHKLTFKVGTPVIFIRSTEAPITVNGTRAVVTALMDNLIEVRISAGFYTGEMILVPRLSPMAQVDHIKNVPLCRVQFLIKPVYAMTINKSQGQTFRCIGIDLTRQCFNHGMLYVALSRVGSPNDIFILNGRITANPVYNEIL